MQKIKRYGDLDALLLDLEKKFQMCGSGGAAGGGSGGAAAGGGSGGGGDLIALENSLKELEVVT